MKRKVKMAWEWNWPHWSLISSTVSFTWLLVDFDTNFKGDHAPGIHFVLCICNLYLIDCGYYNIYHQEVKEVVTERKVDPLWLMEQYLTIRKVPLRLAKVGQVVRVDNQYFYATDIYCIDGRTLKSLNETGDLVVDREDTVEVFELGSVQPLVANRL